MACGSCLLSVQATYRASHPAPTLSVRPPYACSFDDLLRSGQRACALTDLPAMASFLKSSATSLPVQRIKTIDEVSRTARRWQSGLKLTIEISSFIEFLQMKSRLFSLSGLPSHQKRYLHCIHPWSVRDRPAHRRERCL